MKQQPENAPCCEQPHVHKDAVANALSHLPSDEKLYRLCDFFKVFGDITRIKILYVLFDRELCVCDIAQALGLTQSAISHQLRMLKQNRLVKFRRSGKEVYYSLDDGHIYNVLAQGLEHIEE